MSVSISYDQLVLDLFQAYFDARKNKRNKIDSLKFERNFEENVFTLAEEIWERRYKPSRGICFVVDYPVKREIFASNFRDRVVQHLLYNYLFPIYEKKFIHDTYSCRVGKGTEFGVQRAKRFLRACSDNYTKDCFILKLDISSYFMSMNRKILFAQVQKTIEENANLDQNLCTYLLQKIIYSEIEKNCTMKGSRKDWEGLPKNKSLFFAKRDCGLPIGNITSQLFGNVYLNELDHFIKRDLGIKYYGRYVDDMLLMHNQKNYLRYCVEKIDFFLRQNLELQLNLKKTKIHHRDQGFLFVGAYILPYRTYLSKRVVGQVYRYFYSVQKGKTAPSLERSNSYLGLFVHRDSKKMLAKMMREIQEKK